LRVCHISNLSEVQHRRRSVLLLVVISPVSFRGVVGILHGLFYIHNGVRGVVGPSKYRSALRHIVIRGNVKSRILSNFVRAPLFESKFFRSAVGLGFTFEMFRVLGVFVK
jgi:hypothetical protein